MRCVQYTVQSKVVQHHLNFEQMKFYGQGFFSMGGVENLGLWTGNTSKHSTQYFAVKG